MQIPSNHNLAIINAFQSPNEGQSHARRQNSQQAQAQAQAQVLSSQLNPTNSGQQGTRTNRAFVNLQEQNLSHRGQQAQNAYQDISNAGEAELLGRLDVLA